MTTNSTLLPNAQSSLNIRQTEHNLNKDLYKEYLQNRGLRIDPLQIFSQGQDGGSEGNERPPEGEASSSKREVEII